MINEKQDSIISKTEASLLQYDKIEVFDEVCTCLSWQVCQFHKIPTCRYDILQLLMTHPKPHRSACGRRIYDSSPPFLIKHNCFSLWSPPLLLSISSCIPFGEIYVVYFMFEINDVYFMSRAAATSGYDAWFGLSLPYPSLDEASADSSPDSAPEQMFIDQVLESATQEIVSRALLAHSPRDL